jgi:hypothetical protein
MSSTLKTNREGTKRAPVPWLQKTRLFGLIFINQAFHKHRTALTPPLASSDFLRLCSEPSFAFLGIVAA